MAGNTELQSGYDYQFVAQVPEHYICSICHLAMRKPVQTRCGHRFCKDCLHRSLERKRECPLDKNYLTSYQVFEDVATEREILSLHVNCPNHGCSWQGEVRDVKDHESKCPLTAVPCNYFKFGCTFKGPRKSLSEHYKNNLAEHLDIMTQHFLPLEEDNKSLKRMYLALKDENKRRVEELQAKVLMLQDENKKQELKECNTVIMTKDDQSRYSYIWKINDFSRQLQLAKQQDRDIRLCSEPFYTHKNGYKLKLQLYPNGFGAGKGTHVSVFMIIMRGEYDAILSWPFNWGRTFTMLDQKPDHWMRKDIAKGFYRSDASRDVYQRPTTDENVGIGKTNFVSHEMLKTESYVVDGVVFIKFELDDSRPIQN